jgi:transposase
VGGLAEPVRARRLTDQEGRKLQQIVRRGRHESVRVRRALIIMASASGTTVPAIARLVAAHEDTVRDVIHAFNERGLAALDPQWAGGRPRLISSDDEVFIVTAAITRPVKLGRPFTHWSIRKLADYLADNPVRVVKVGRERLRRSCGRTESPSSARGLGRSPKIRTRTSSWIGSRRVTSRFPSHHQGGVSVRLVQRGTSVARCSGQAGGFRSSGPRLRAVQSSASFASPQLICSQQAASAWSAWALRLAKTAGRSSLRTVLRYRSRSAGSVKSGLGERSRAAGSSAPILGYFNDRRTRRSKYQYSE